MSTGSIIALIDSWLSRQLKTEAATWLSATGARIAAEGGATRTLFIAFGQAARRTGKEDLLLTADDLAAASAQIPEWNPSRWSCDQLARIRLVLSLPSSDAKTWLATLDLLFASSGMEELVALYQGLALLPHPQVLTLRAAEGVRTNMQTVFEAIALGNPYPAAYFDESPWNQMVVKTLFVGRPLARITGLDRRANPRLSRILLDLARERHAAHRPIADDLWPTADSGADAAQRVELQRLLANVRAGTPAAPVKAP